MYKKLNTYKKDNRGSAMIIALVVSVVVIMFCLSLLLVSYSLFASSNRKITQNQCRELAKTLSIELENELTQVSYKDFDEQKQALNDGSDTLWQYLRYNICQDNWPYYEADNVTGHDINSSYRYFDTNVSGGNTNEYESMADDISVCIYWADDGEYVDNKNGIKLYIRVTCTKGEQSAEITSVYELTCEDYDTKPDNEADNGNNSVNPSDNSIATSEKWRWSLLERE